MIKLRKNDRNNKLLDKPLIPFFGGVANNPREEGEKSRDKYKFTFYMSFGKEHDKITSNINDYSDSVNKDDALIFREQNQDEFKFKFYFKNLDVFRGFVVKVLRNHHLETKDDFALEAGIPKNLPPEYFLSEAKKIISKYHDREI